MRPMRRKFERKRKRFSNPSERSIPIRERIRFFIRRIIRMGKRISVFRDEKFGHIERLKPAEFLAIRREFSMGFHLVS